MYLKLQNLVLLGATLVAAVPTANNVTSDTLLSQETSGHPISPDPPLKEIQRVAAALDGKDALLELMDNDTHIILHKKADGTRSVSVGGGTPPVWGCRRDDFRGHPDLAAQEPRGLAKRGPSEDDIERMGQQLDSGTHIVISKSWVTQWSINKGFPSKECLKPKSPAREASAAVEAEDLGAGDIPPVTCLVECFRMQDLAQRYQCYQECRE